MVVETYSDKETLEFGKKLGSEAGPGAIFCLDGDLGTGKTVIAKGIALGLGITEPVSSPTFTVIKEYHEGRLPFYHFDVYRIEDPVEMDEIGYEDYFFGDGVTVIEWSDMIQELIPQSAIKIKLSKDMSKGFDYRRISVESTTVG
jgi:tRNA threonylcarbamoyladenosine biosynthesis protein TsaE